VECFQVIDLEPCNNTYYVFLKVVDACGDTSLSWANGVTRCDYMEALCDGARGARLVAVSEEGSQVLVAPVELSLTGPQPNPGGRQSRVVLGVPAGLDGTAYELTLYDVAGRRVSVVGKGVAKVGYTAFEILPPSGRRTAAGVYFLKLVVGNQKITRTVIVSN
jgi:hypothetical protein